MKELLAEFRHNKLTWLLVFVPAVFLAKGTNPEAHTLIFFLAVAAIVPLAAVLSRATESVGAKTGDAVGGLLNATLGNLVELVITLTALRQGMMDLVKGSLAGAIVTNSLFMLGGSFLLGGLKHRLQEFNRTNAGVQSGLMVTATVALIVPAALQGAEGVQQGDFLGRLSVGLSVLLMVAYALSLLFSLKTHKDLFASAGGGHGEEETPWPLPVALGSLAVVTLLVALVSEIFVESVQHAALSLGLSPAFVGFVIVSLVGGAAEMATAFGAARKNKLDLSVSIAMGSSTQIALFVAPLLVLLSYVIAPAPMDLVFRPGLVLMVLIASFMGSLATRGGRSAWYLGSQLLAVYLVFAITLYMLPG